MFIVIFINEVSSVLVIDLSYYSVDTVLTTFIYIHICICVCVCVCVCVSVCEHFLGLMNVVNNVSILH